MSKFRQSLGKDGESIAVEFLKNRGYNIVERNFRCRSGEIDIIAYDGSCLVFIEVKTRSSAAFGSPAAAVGRAKQQQICRASQFYLSRTDAVDCDIRFDVVGIVTNGRTSADIELYTNAFEFCL